MTGRRRICVGTIVAGNFLAFARVLGQSLREHHPDLPFHAVVIDRADAPLRQDELFEILSLDSLDIPELRRRQFAYTRQELVVAAKPYLLRHLLARGFETAVFLDADMLVVSGLQTLLHVAAAHAVTLTPHLLDPLRDDDRMRRELNILQSGVYNGGVVAVSRGACADRFLSWWGDRLHTHCRHDAGAGLHYDQRWLDLAPAFFEDVHVVRDPGCNVAHWNLPERSDPFCLFHFSGFDPAQPDVVTKYSDRLTMDAIGQTASLFRRYADLLTAAGHDVSSKQPYGFGSFDNGIPIPDVARRLYDEMGADAERFGDPFCSAGRDSFFRWLTCPAASRDHGITPLWARVYRSRPDLQRRFPDPSGSDFLAFRAWVLETGVGEHDIDRALAP